MTLDQKILIACGFLGLAMLYYMSAYLEARENLRDVCGYIGRIAAKTPEGSEAGLHGLDDAYLRCWEAHVLNTGRPGWKAHVLLSGCGNWAIAHHARISRASVMSEGPSKLAGKLLTSSDRKVAGSSVMIEVDVVEAMAQYAAVRKKTAGMIVRDAAELPYPKDFLKESFRGLFERAAGNDQLLEACKQGYLGLADFQDLSEEERIALAALSSQNSDTASALPVMERVTAERHRLEADVKSFMVEYAYDPDDIIGKYSAVLEDVSAGSVIRDAADLPYPKIVIKRALRGLIDQWAGDEAAQDKVKVTYLHLADFQELTDEERTAVAAMSQHGMEAWRTRPPKEQAHHFAQFAEANMRVHNRFKEELARLSAELETGTKSKQRGADDQQSDGASSKSMKGLGRVVTNVGYVLLCATAALLFLGLVSTWHYEGFSKVQEIMSPVNVVQYLTTLLMLAPGFALVKLGEWLEKNASGVDNKR